MIRSVASSLFAGTVLAHANVPADQVLCLIGTGWSASAVGTTETDNALADGSPLEIGFSAFEKGLVDIDVDHSTEDDVVFLRAQGDRIGERISIEEIDGTWGTRLREDRMIRQMDSSKFVQNLTTYYGAPLAQGLGDGGLQRLSGLYKDNFKGTKFFNMRNLFDEDPAFRPSLQSMLFMYAGLGALSALPDDLPKILPEAHRMMVSAGCCYPGQDSYEAMAGDEEGDKSRQLAAYLNTHGPAMINTMLSPGFELSKVLKDRALLEYLTKRSKTILYNVLQSPTVKRYQFRDNKLRDAFLKRWPGIMTACHAREARYRRTRGGILELAEKHRYPNMQELMAA